MGGKHDPHTTPSIGEKDPASREALLVCKGIEIFVLLVAK